MLGGLAIGFIPGVPVPQFEPDVVFLFFLPPPLYSAAFMSSTRELAANTGPISLFAVGPVLATMAAVTVVAHVVVGIAWAPAFVLGAVLGPTDPVSATAVIRRLGAPERIVTILLCSDGMQPCRFMSDGAESASISIPNCSQRPSSSVAERLPGW